ncbi:DNA repair protein RAD16 [Marchantia polymorpha subsp. ruderalis]
MSSDQPPPEARGRGGRKNKLGQTAQSRPSPPRTRSRAVAKPKLEATKIEVLETECCVEKIELKQSNGDNKLNVSLRRTRRSISTTVQQPVLTALSESEEHGDRCSSEASLSSDSLSRDPGEVHSTDDSGDSESLTSENSDGSAEGTGNKRRRRSKSAVQSRGSGRGRGRGRGRGQGRASRKKDMGKKVLEWEIFQEKWESQWGGMEDEEIEAFNKQSNPVEQRNPSSDVRMPLLPFQKEWLAWGLKQEASEIQGGILADEMGMGKTIQAISLIVTDRALHGPFDSKRQHGMQNAGSVNGSCEGAESIKELPQVKATLVICPMVAVSQWRSEIEKFTAPGSMKVLVYHGPKRGMGINELMKYDVVLSTYAIVECEHRKHVMPPKQHCKWCAKTFYPDRLAIHQRYFCGPNAQRTAKQSKQVRRKITALALGKYEESESDEDNKPVKGEGEESTSGKRGAASTGRRGRKRKIDADDVGAALQEDVDCVADTPTSSSGRIGNSLLHSVKWGRIVLDEAHSIKDRRCSTAKAIFALRSIYKWALSGTPLQNRVGELYSLVRFLGVYPFSYYFCRKCDCKSLDYKFSFGQKCECGHSALLHFCWWNKFIANPIKKWGYIDEGRTAMTILKHLVLQKCLLRRTKTERAADLSLPPRTISLRRDVFDDREKDFYEALYSESQLQFNTYVHSGTLLNNYAHIFDLLIRLRQAVNHPYLVVYSAASSAAAPQFDGRVQDPMCGICYDPAEDLVSTGCQHHFCRICMEEHMEAGLESKRLQCPTCHIALSVDMTRKSEETKEVVPKLRKRSSILNRIKLDNFQSSTKINAVKEEIFLMLAKDPGAKAIIFSQFTAMLELIGFFLQKSGIGFVKLDGSMSMQARDYMIDKFTTDADTKIFLMSLKAGGVALNLTVASHVFLMDPWWNPAVEQQAQDRIHRLGQTKAVRIIRFVIQNTIEDRILKLQEKKQLVFEGTVGGSAEAMGRLTEEDLRFLFNN